MSTTPASPPRPLGTHRAAGRIRGGGPTEEDERAANRRARYSAEAGPGDSAQIYLEQMGHVTLLTAEEEVELAKQIKAGLDAAERLRATHASGLATPRGRADIARIVRDGECARNRLLEANLELVVPLAKRYVGRGVAFLDLIQEGNLGLMRAALKFDHTKGHTFSTHALWWIRQAMVRAVADQARTVRLPTHIVYLTNKLDGIHRCLAENLGRKPSHQELATQMRVSLEEMLEIQSYARTPFSLDQPLAGMDFRPLDDLIEDAPAEAAAEAAAFAPRGEQLRAMLSELSEWEAGVLRLRFGLTDGQRHTLGQIGTAYGVHRELIRQVELAAMTKLRDLARIPALPAHPT